MFRVSRMLAAIGMAAMMGVAAAADVAPVTHEEILAALRDPINSTGNVADAVDEATGARGWMSSDMKPIFDTKIVGRAATALMRPVLRNARASTRTICSRSSIRPNPAASSST